MKLVGSTKNKTNNDKNGEKALHLEITEVVLSKPARGTTRYTRYYEVLQVVLRDTTRYYNWYYEILRGTKMYNEWYHETVQGAKRYDELCYESLRDITSGTTRYYEVL